MRSSRRNRRAASALFLTLAIAGAAGVSAHRRDEYLQAARLAIEPGIVQLELNLTPGIELADAIIADIDGNRDGSLSRTDEYGYARRVLDALTLEIDGATVRPQLAATSFPSTDAIKRGEGTIRLQLAARLPSLAAGSHQLLFRNRHDPGRSVYLANALAPATTDVTITGQQRDTNQTELRIDYLLRAAPDRLHGTWLLAGLTLATVLAALLAGRSPRSPTSGTATRTGRSPR